MQIRALVGSGRKVIVIGPEAPLSEAMDLLLTHEIGALPVVEDDDRPVGILSERDVVRALHKHGAPTPTLSVRRAMRTPPPTCELDTTVLEATSRMTRERARHLIVCGEGRLVAVLSVGDLVKHRLEQMETEASVLRDYVAAQRARM
ncbi:MAG: CBS domain-containing protein [Gemmatimonadetes bacterium]|nr:CBS domain-containing protein [Gemmatimonadota bacterium]